MIYPRFIKENDCIAVTSPSDGITKKEKIYRLDNAIKKFRELGFNIKETNNVRTSDRGRSSSAITRARELEELFIDNNISTIICSSGGDFLLEMLSELDFEVIKNNPKWLQGFSDPTGLLYTITTNLDIATIYADNFISFGMSEWHKSLYNNLEILKGNIIEQTSFLKYESSYTNYIVGDEVYNLDSDVYWKILNRSDEVNLSGRMIGGCLDIINDLFGTRFDKTLEFINKYKSDGIIWYLENCEMSNEQLVRTLWKLRDNGYFNYTNGIIFGRSATDTSYYDISFDEAIMDSLGSLDIPIIINADIGHVSPRMTIINGSIANINVNNGKGKIRFDLK